MTCSKWTTKDQEAWLEEQNPAFVVANQKWCTVKEFFPVLTNEFRNKWPVSEVTEKEIKHAGSLEKAIRIKKDKYDKVSLTNNVLDKKLTDL